MKPILVVRFSEYAAVDDQHPYAAELLKQAILDKNPQLDLDDIVIICIDTDSTETTIELLKLDIAPTVTVDELKGMIFD